MILQRYEPMEWAEQGACRDGDPEVMFPDRQADEREAAKTCRPCPVINECLLYALEHGIDHGVWGGLTAHERRVVRRRASRARARAAAPPRAVQTPAATAPAGVRDAAARGVPLRELAASMRGARP